MSDSATILDHSPLCTKCTSIFTAGFIEWEDDDDGGKPHHTTWKSLRESISEGCYICARLQEGLTEGEAIDIRFRGIGIPLNVSDFDVNFTIHNGDDSPIEYGFPCLRVNKAMHRGMQGSVRSGTCSIVSLRQARRWIDRCCSTHDRCAMPVTNSWLPNRLVHIEGYSMSRFSARLCDRHHLPSGILYLTLSHRWGGSKFVTLTNDVLERWQRKIPVNELSHVFQDALSVTHALGFAYIWIDSLCIVQDDLEDWKTESKTMHRIYRSATCNLSATDFDNGEAGLVNTQRLHNPVPPIIRPMWPEFPSWNGDTRKEYHTISSDQHYYLMEEDPFIRVYSGPLLRRAWVLQEQILVR